MKIIENVIIFYENLNVKFVGDKQYYFMDTDMLKGIALEGVFNKKKTRTWFEKKSNKELVDKEIIISNMRDRLIELGESKKDIAYLEKVQK